MSQPRQPELPGSAGQSDQSEMKGEERSSPWSGGAIVTTGLTVAAYLVLNSTLNLMNKWALGVYGFHFPILMTACHMAFCFFALLPVMLREPFRSLHKPTLKKQWVGLVGIGLFLALNISLNNSSLVLISLTLNQIVRSAIPVITCVLAIFIEGKVPSKAEVTSLVILTAGVMIAVFEGTISGSVTGIAICVMGTVCNAAMMTTSGRLMSEKLDVLRLTFYTSPVSCVALLPFYAYREASAFSEYRLGRSGAISMIILVGSLNALAYNVIHYLMIQKTSAVATTVLGEIKVIGLLVLSSLLLGESREFTTRMTIGCVLAMVGFCGYSHCKLMQQQSKSSPIIKGVPDSRNGVAYSRVPNDRSAV